jgi:hypothetical protein
MASVDAHATYDAATDELSGALKITVENVLRSTAFGVIEN